MDASAPFPPEVAWIKANLKKNELKEPDVLTGDEAMAMVRIADKPRGKAFIAVLYEGGFRIGEALTARVGDVEFDENGARLKVPRLVKDEAEFMIRKLYERRLRGKVRDRLSVVLSVLYITCIKNGFIVEYKKFVKLGMNGRAYNKVKALVNTPIVRESPTVYVERYAQELGFSEADVRNALNIINEKGFSGTPRIAAIASLYVAKYGNDLTHISTVSKRAKMSHISLKNYVLKFL